jgi:hypothetical protein
MSVLGFLTRPMRRCHARWVTVQGSSGDLGEWHFDAEEPGWVSGCRPEDEPWVTEYGFLDFPKSIAKPVDALPPGYPACTAVLHSLEDPDSDGRVKWINDPDNNPWDQIEHIVDHGLGTWQCAAMRRHSGPGRPGLDPAAEPGRVDNPMAQPEGSILSDVLALDINDVELTITYFFPPSTGTAHSATVAGRLRSADHSLWHVPVFWFPHTRAWVASTPYDAGWTYIASSTDIAQHFLDDRRIEALRCSYQDRQP